MTADFSGGHLSSDGGLLFIREVENRRGILGKLAGCFIDSRLQWLAEHNVEEWVRQRIGALAPSTWFCRSCSCCHGCGSWRWVTLPRGG